MAFKAQQGLSGVWESWVGWRDGKNSQILALRLPPRTQAQVPSACLGSAALRLWPGQAPGVVCMSILLLAHGGRCPQALGPQQGPRAPGSLGPQPCGDRKGVRRPATVDYNRGHEGESEQGGSGDRPRRELREGSEEEEAERAKVGACGGEGDLTGTVSATQR